MPLTRFHPAVERWFTTTFAGPTDPQRSAWPAIQDRRHTLIAAPTGSGKTLAAFLAAIDALVREGVAGDLPDETQVLYVSPLKALSNDIQRNLEWPLAGIREQLQALGLPGVDIRALVRTGDTTPGDRAAMRKRPPHILVTTPESLYLLLTSESGRRMLATVRSVIVDEIHAVAASKRGSHLALSLERLRALVAPRRLVRIGLSATQKPIEDIARFLVGGDEPCTLVDTGHVRERDLALALPDAPLEAVMSNEVWGLVYDRLAALVATHRTTLVFVNTRRLAERVTRHLSERLGKDHIASHHGSLSKEHRLAAEQRLKAGELKVLVATASLELGIDIGEVDLVCQLGTPRSIATFLQRVGRSGHAIGAVPKGRLFPLSRDELVECAALLDAVARGELDRLRIPEKPLDVLAQQVVAEVSACEWAEPTLFDTVRRAYPYRKLTRDEFDSVVAMLSDGYATRRGRSSAYLHHDAVNQRLRARRGARLVAVTCGGAIPDNADYQVILEPTQTFIGTVNEDFAVESLSGDVFQLGNHSYRILRIEAGRLRVEDAQGQPPNIPFWIGEAPARTDELSAAVSRLRADLDAHLTEISTTSLENAVAWLRKARHLDESAARQIVEYLAAAKGVLGVLPTQATLVMERFFDESGGMQLVIHAPFGSRINRAWGLALRKRFCRKFNFELQAAATEDALVLSLGETHSFPLEEVTRYLHSASVRAVLVQALLTAPLFTARWRWNASIALAIQRYRAGRKRPAPLLRMDAEDLIAVVFPDQIACPENLAGERDVPDHPLVNQTLSDCLHEAMDIDGLEALLRALERDERQIVTRDLPHPSPLAQEILNAKPYAFLDDAPLEERRTQAVMSRRWLDPINADDLGRLDPAAIARVREEAWPTVERDDELHDALMLLGAITEAEGQAQKWDAYFDSLVRDRRAARLSAHTHAYWVVAERLPLLQTLLPHAHAEPALAIPGDFSGRTWSADEAVTELVRGRLQVTGPVTGTALTDALALPLADIEGALLALEAEGFALRGRFTDEAAAATEWCERRLLARIHRYTVKTLRAEIEPVGVADYLRFLFDWHGVTSDPRPEGPQALAAVIAQLEGFEAPASAWEADLLPARLSDYDSNALDGLCLSGRVVWTRLSPIGSRRGAQATEGLSAPSPIGPRRGAQATDALSAPSPAAGDKERVAGPIKATPIALLTRAHLPLWHALIDAHRSDAPRLSHGAQAVLDYLRAHGASFFDEIVDGSRLLKSQAEGALGELVSSGLVNADSFSGLRALLIPADRRRAFAGGRRRRLPALGIEEAGRWALLRRDRGDDDGTDRIDKVARILLGRYGVVFRGVLEREPDWLPPWYDLLRVYRRLEARGEIRGGRFVAGVSGEQYALPEAVGALRALRRAPGNGRLVAVSAADPLNLVGILTPGPRVPALAGNRVLYRDGVPIATQIAGEARFLVALEPAAEWETRNALLRTTLSAPRRDLN
jgi:ATP-dependent Lhr-like helicase